MTRRIRSQVAIIGAGPAGLMLSHLLHLDGVESIVVEARTRRYVEERIRAGVLEQGTVDLLRQTGVGERLDREGLTHCGVELVFEGVRHRIDLQELTGKCITIYGQHEVIKDLIAARLAAKGQIFFDASNVAVHDIEGAPRVTFEQDGEEYELTSDLLAGCDGFHGICREAIPDLHLRIFERVYPFAWLGVLAQSAPSGEELVYAHHERGFALFSMRSPQVTRLYLQCRPDEDLTQWTDDRIWLELDARLRTNDGWSPTPGPILQKSVTPMRSFVAEPMQYSNLFLAGDAAHIVPPTGAKGMNLAVSDVLVLSRAITAFYRKQNREALDAYSQTCLRRIWMVQRFSWWMTSLLHTFEHDCPFDRRRQLAELSYLTESRAAMTSLAENYVGLPLDR